MKLPDSLQKSLLTGICIWLILIFNSGCGSSSIDDASAVSEPIANLVPKVANSSPSGNERDVSIDATVQLTFNKAMDPSSFSNATYTVTESGTSVEGTFAFDSEKKKLTFTPASTLSYSSSYTVTVSSSVIDTVGNHPSADYTLQFRTIPQPVAEISTGFNHTCAKLAGGAMKCWGRNRNGQLGQGDTDYRGDDSNELGDQLPVIDLGSGKIASGLFTGGAFSCAILSDNNIKCWGSNDLGQLGLGDNTTRGINAGEMGDNLSIIDLGTGRTVKRAVSGEVHNCAILDNNTLKCWGFAEFGNLGLGDNISRGNDPGEMGDVLNTVDLGTGRTATSLAAGRNHTCAILDDASLKCWGRNDYGQLGILDKTVDIGDAANEMGNDLAPVDLGTPSTVSQVSCGLEHTCALLTDKTIKCWGRNDYGQLGLENATGLGTSEAMGDALTAVDVGSNLTPVSLYSGGHHNCVILSDQSVRCWGRNDYGQLGTGNTDTIGDNTGEMGDNLVAVDLGTSRTATQLSLGQYHTCALLDNKTVKCWGRNNYGQLGLGDTTNRGDEAEEMGDALYSVDTGSN